MTLPRRPKIEDFYSGSQSKEALLAIISTNRQFDPSGLVAALPVVAFLAVFIATFSPVMAIMLAALSIIPAGIIGFAIRTIFLDRKKESQVAEAKIALEQIQRYEAALEQYLVWQTARNSETSDAYWLRFKGIELEERVASMLRRVGWTVTTTRVTGDGGIDLKARRKDQYYYLQCKGHSSRVGVASIRDAAGVSLTASVTVIVVAPSGFSPGARQFAAKAGVVLWDSTSLAKVASGSDFAECGASVP